MTLQTDSFFNRNFKFSKRIIFPQSFNSVLDRLGARGFFRLNLLGNTVMRTGQKDPQVPRQSSVSICMGFVKIIILTILSAAT